MTPQLTEGFHRQASAMSTQSIDVDYRQSLTKKSLRTEWSFAELNRQAAYYQVFDDVAGAVDQMQAFCGLLSQQNLNPDVVVYTVTTPFMVRTTSGLSLSTTVLYLFVALFAALISFRWPVWRTTTAGTGLNRRLPRTKCSPAKVETAEERPRCRLVTSEVSLHDRRKTIGVNDDASHP